MSEITPNHTVIEHPDGLMRFVVSGTPNSGNIASYIQLWKSLGVVSIARACEPTTFEASVVEKEGISVNELWSKDGDVPTKQIIDEWLNLVKTVFSTPSSNSNKKPAIAVMCIAGLGRSPLLVALALIEHGGIGDSLKVVDFIRSKRQGALNVPQIKFLRSYKPQSHSNCSIS